MIKTHYVYKFIDTANKVIYVGETNNIERRIREHLSCNPAKTCFRKADLKNISRIEFLKLNTIQEGKLIEKYYILKYLSPCLKNKSIPHTRIKIKNPPDNHWRIYKFFRGTTTTKKSSKKYVIVAFLYVFIFWITILYHFFK